MREITRSLGGRRGNLALSLILTLSSAVMTLVWNALVSDLIDRAASGLEPLPALYCLGIAEALLSALLAFCAAYAAGALFEGVGHDLRMRYARALAYAPLARAEALSSARALSLMQNEVHSISAFLRDNAMAMVDDALRFCLTFAWMLMLDWRLAILANLPLIPIFFYIGWSSGEIQTATGKQQEEAKALNGWAEALTAAFPVVRVFMAEEPFRGWHREALSRWRSAASKVERRRAALMSLSGFLGVIPLLLLFLIGGAHVIRGEIGVGTLYVFINLSGSVSGVVQNLPGRAAAYRSFRANVGSLDAALRELEG